MDVTKITFANLNHLLSHQQAQLYEGKLSSIPAPLLLTDREDDDIDQEYFEDDEDEDSAWHKQMVLHRHVEGGKEAGWLQLCEA